MPEPERVEFENGQMRAEVRVRRATLLDSVRRTRLIETGKAADEKDVDRWLLRVMIYPDLASCTDGWYTLPGETDLHTWPPDFEEFSTLPDDLGIAVQSAVYRVNPHWQPPTEKEEDEKGKKKELMSSSSG